MAELAKSFITISDESAYGAGVNTIIPLYVFATKSNKVLDASTGEIAPGTTIANELLVMTSQRDVINTFGVPNFTKVNGIVMQGDELNEVGLLGLYNAMGSSSLGYAVRADIDLGQLQPSTVEPKTSVEDGTKWLDLSTSSFGVYRSNGSNATITINQWDYVNVKIYDSLEEADKTENDIIFVKTTSGGEFYECLSNEWYLIGSSDWATKVDNNVTFTFATYNNMPENQPEGSIWISMSSYNDGTELNMRVYNSILSTWSSHTIPMFNSYIEAEDYFGSALVEGTMFALCGNDNGEAVITVKEYSRKEGETSFITPSEETTLTPDTVLSGYYIFNVAGLDNSSVNNEDKEGYCNCSDAEHNTVSKVIVYFNKFMKSKGIDSVEASLTNGELVFESTDGLSIGIETGDGFSEITKIEDKEVEISWNDAKNVEISINEPKDEPKDGTLWFDSEEKYDILVNTGSAWKGLSVAHSNAELYITSEKPSGEINPFSLWIDTNAENYPAIYRYESTGWKLLDNSDQTSAYGVLFADARYYDDEDKPLTMEIADNGKVSGTILTSSTVDPDAPKATAYPKEMILFNTRFSSNNVKKYVKNAFPGKSAENVPGKTLSRWVSASGNALNGAGLFGAKAQRKMIVDALAGAINSCEELRSINYDFFYATCPGYPEIDNELMDLNKEKKEMFYIVSDTPKTLAPTVRAITDWGINANNADHGLDGRVIRDMYITRQYPPMGMTSNVDGEAVAVPTSFVKMKNLLNLPKGAICAGSQYGVVSNVSSVGYITDEDEYAPVSLSDGIGDIIVSQSMNPIIARRNTGLLLWGENTENNGNTSLSDEHAILTLLRLKRELDAAVTPFFFRKNIKSTRDDFDYVLRTILSSYVTNEELYDFVLDTETPNTSETISRKELHANIAIEIVKGIEFIFIPIRVVNTGTLSSASLSA